MVDRIAEKLEKEIERMSDIYEISELSEESGLQEEKRVTTSTMTIDGECVSKKFVYRNEFIRYIRL